MYDIAADDIQFDEGEFLPEDFSTIYNEETLSIIKGSNGSILVYVENGRIAATRPVRENEIVISIESCAELLTQAGYTVTKQETISGI
ncbi:hypothetical protein ACIPMZ_17945 [Scandinavium goeteborgense]|uniref:hypothetical protein n=1 Tax=Scandinavium goeteborgense TaxID=1851514 RepID=UPI0038058CF9